MAVIEAVVDLDGPETAKVKWKNVKGHDSDFICSAREKNQKWGGDEYPKRVFLLSPLEETAFHKGTKGGMFGSKRYFDVGALGASDAKDLATELRDRSWPEDTWIVSNKEPKG